MLRKNKDVKMPGEQRDDALFEALGKSKKRKKRKIIITVVSIVLVLAIIAVVGVSILQKKVREEFASSSGEVLSYEVSTGTISTVVSGSGTLTDEDLEEILVPEGVEVTEILIKTNDAITEGDVLATVDMATVMSAMADLQAEIEALDEEISDAEDDEADNIIYAGVSGRVKVIFAEKGEDVADVMYDDGALALISLDGYMAVDVTTDVLAEGDTVTVKLSDDKKVTGTVESVSGGVATVLVTDNGTDYDEAVTVLNDAGEQIGEGNLYIHNALRVIGYAGTVESVSVSTDDKVSGTSKMFTLEDTAYSANYNSLLRTRSEKEETLLELLSIKRNGAVVAPVSGSVYSVDYSQESTDEITGASAEGTAIATLSVDKKMSVTIDVNEADILSLELGQEVTVTVSSVSEDDFTGTLTEINRTSSSSGTYSAVVELEKAEGMLSGMTASVSVKIEGVENAILIPIEALHQTSDGAYVYTSYDEERQEYGGKVDVVTGLENSTYVEIKSGLSVGDTVYYTEATSGFGNFGGGGMPGFSGGEMPDFGGGEMPDFGGGERPGGGGGMPDFGGGQMPGGFSGGN